MQPHSCAFCVAGTFQERDGRTACDPCPVGHWCPEGAFEKEPCPRGTFRNLTGGDSKSSCSSCAPGTAAPEMGQTACDPCEAGFESSSHATTCSPCARGTYATAAMRKCEPCFRGDALATSYPRARDESECFCMPDSFFRASTRECVQCTELARVGLLCPGGPERPPPSVLKRFLGCK